MLRSDRKGKSGIIIKWEDSRTLQSQEGKGSVREKFMQCTVLTMTRIFANKNKFEFFKNALECLVLCCGQYYMW